MISDDDIIYQMRTIIQIPDAFAKLLSEICRREKISRAEAIRRAIAQYTKEFVSQEVKDNSAFGMWKNRKIDSLAFERSVRKEWKSR